MLERYFGDGGQDKGQNQQRTLSKAIWTIREPTGTKRGNAKTGRLDAPLLNLPAAAVVYYTCSGPAAHFSVKVGA